MAFGAFIQAATAVDSTSTTVNIGGAGWTSNITAGNIIVVGLRVGSLGAFSVVSDQAPTSFTKAVEQQQTVDGHTTSIQFGVNQTGAVKPTITFTNPGALSVRMVAVEYTGSANTHLDKVASNQGTSTAPSSGVTATRTDATELQIGVESNANAQVPSAGAGFNIRGTIPANKLAIEDIVRSATGTEAADFTSASDTWTALTATFSDTIATSNAVVGPQISSNKRTGGQASRRLYKSQTQIPYFTPPSPPSTTSGGNLTSLGVG